MSDSVSRTASKTEAGSQIPAKIGRYDIVEKLGSGSTGTVYRATDPFIGRSLAIKTFRLDLNPGPERDRFLQRFYHEARISGGLSHPNIVALFDVGEVNGLPYLVFEHVDGPTLDVALARSGRLDSAESIRVVEQTASALDFAHARGVVHRDIRPANIILATDRRVRIADFGIARVEGSHLTQHGEVLGTPAYMSPEQIRGQGLSPSSDLFSLAVCAYEMLSGQRPFAGKDQTGLVEALVYSPPEEPKELRALGIPSRDFMFVFERALAKDPAHRFADGASFARALKSCLGVAAFGDEARPVERIAIPPTPPPPRRVILPPVAPPSPSQVPAAPLPTPPQRSGTESPRDSGGVGGPAVDSLSNEAPPDLSPEATLVSAVAFDPALPPQGTVSSVDATMVSPRGTSLPSAPLAPFDGAATAAIEGGSGGAPGPVVGPGPEPSSAATLVSNVAPDQTVSFPRTNASADVTMVSPSAEEDGPAPPRLSREAVESLLANPAPSGSAPVLQKTLPGSDQTPMGSSGPVIDGGRPPHRDRSMLPVSPPLSASQSGRTAIGSSPAATLYDPNSSGGGLSAVDASEATVIMSEAERLKAAKQRVLDRSAMKGPAAPPSASQKIRSTPSMSQTSATYRGATSRPASRPPVVPPAVSQPSLVVPRSSSLLPKVVVGGACLLLLMAAAVAAILWGRGGGPSPPAEERWNNQLVYTEAAVDKSPLPLSIDIPQPTLEPGRVVSITVSWIVTTEGGVADPRVEESASPEIDAFVVEGIRKWRYEPAVKDGKVTPVRVVRKYTFPPRGSSQGG